MTEFVDPELRDDREELISESIDEIDLPEYDPSQFEPEDDFEFDDLIGGEDDGEED